MVRPAQHLAAADVQHVDRPLDVIQPLLPNRRIRRDRIRLGTDDGDGRAAEAVVVERLADGLVVGRIALEDRQLDAVVAGGLELGEQRELLGRDVGGPEQEVEAVFHGRGAFEEQIVSTWNSLRRQREFDGLRTVDFVEGVEQLQGQEPAGVIVVQDRTRAGLRRSWQPCPLAE